MRSFGRLLMTGLLLLSCSLQALAQTESENHDQERKNRDKTHLNVQQYFEILGRTITILEREYVDSIDWADVLQTGIDAMLHKLDPYSELISEAEHEDFVTMTSGEYGGVGAVIQQRGDTVIISDPYEEMPALAAGLRAGDRILAIDNVSMIGKTVSEVSEKLRGVPNSTFVLRVKRPYQDEPFETTITRKIITLDAVTYSGWLNDSIAYINLNSFTNKAAQEVRAALLDFRNDTTRHFGGLIFDLRENGGGLMEEAVKIVGLFVPKGSIVTETKGKIEARNTTYRTQENPIEPNLPLVILTSEGTASASEIVSGALQDMDRAVIVGEKTFGKGLVQSSMPMSYGTILKFTTSKYYIPSGRCIQAIDYRQRQTDGHATRIPDSLRHVFHTAGGREVRDGGGITPDIECKEPNMSYVLHYAVLENIIFDFVTHYRHLHDSIARPETFRISEEDYKRFCQQYKEQAEDSVLQKLKIDLEHDLDSLKQEMTWALTEEILRRYYHQDGAFSVLLQSSKVVARAREILNNPAAYEEILHPTHLRKAEGRTKKSKRKKQ